MNAPPFSTPIIPPAAPVPPLTKGIPKPAATKISSKAPAKPKAPSVVITAPPPPPAAKVLAELPPVSLPPAQPSKEFEERLPEEDEDSHQIRVKYYRAALQNLLDSHNRPIAEDTARLFGRLAVNRVKYGVRYPSRLEDQMKFLDSKV